MLMDTWFKKIYQTIKNVEVFPQLDLIEKSHILHVHQYLCLSACGTILLGQTLVIKSMLANAF